MPSPLSGAAAVTQKALGLPALHASPPLQNIARIFYSQDQPRWDGLDHDEVPFQYMATIGNGRLHMPFMLMRCQMIREETCQRRKL